MNKSHRYNRQQQELKTSENGAIDYKINVFKLLNTEI